MLWHRQAIFESKGDKLFSSAECRIRTQGLRHLFASRLNACWQTDWAIEDQAKNMNSTARPYDQQAFSPLDLTASWHCWFIVNGTLWNNFDVILSKIRLFSYQENTHKCVACKMEPLFSVLMLSMHQGRLARLMSIIGSITSSINSMTFDSILLSHTKCRIMYPLFHEALSKARYTSHQNWLIKWAALASHPAAIWFNPHGAMEDAMVFFCVKFCKPYT